MKKNEGDKNKIKAKKEKINIGQKFDLLNL